MAKLNTEQRIQAIKRYLYENVSMGEIAKSIGIHQTILSGWIRLYETHGLEAFLKSYTNYPVCGKKSHKSRRNRHGDR